jgi:hypothetical protein
MTPQLTAEMQSAVEQQHGGPVQILGTGDAAYVLMSMEVYRHLMGVGADTAFAASVQAVQRGYGAIERGESRPLREALDDLGRKHEVPR